jgi:hypothetical protein
MSERLDALLRVVRNEASIVISTRVPNGRWHQIESSTRAILFWYQKHSRLGCDENCIKRGVHFRAKCTKIRNRSIAGSVEALKAGGSINLIDLTVVEVVEGGAEALAAPRTL